MPKVNHLFLLEGEVTSTSNRLREILDLDPEIPISKVLANSAELLERFLSRSHPLFTPF